MTRDEALALIAKHGSQVAASRAEGVTRWSIQAALHGWDRKGEPPPAKLDPVQEARVVIENKRLREQIAELTGQRAEDMELADLARTVRRSDPPAWAVKAPEGHKKNPSIGQLLLSDLHYGEKVNPAEVGGVNEFNAEIAQARLAAFFRNAVCLFRDHFSGVSIEGVVLNLLGDNVSGEIHEELTETNDRTMPEALIDLVGILPGGIRLLAEEFGKVHVVAVPGNHGRMTRKPQAKRRSRRNYDWLLACLIARAMEGDKRVTFAVSDAADHRYTVYSTRFLATHGDQFRGGSGISGAMAPLMLGDHRKRKRNAAMGQEYDWMLLGHWHQLMLGNSGFIMNGAVKGYDEYAYLNNFGFEPPQQAAFLVDPKHGVTLRAPVFLED